MKYNSYLLFLYLLIIFLTIYYILTHKVKYDVEGYQSTYVSINDNSNESSEYSKTVDLPLTFPFSCKNF